MHEAATTAAASATATRRGRREEDGEEEEEEEEQAPLVFARELPDDKLLALLAACPGKPSALRQ